MKKSIYISPQSRVVTFNPIRFIAASDFAKGDGNFDPESMDYVKEENPPINDVNVWDDEW